MLSSVWRVRLAWEAYGHRLEAGGELCLSADATWKDAIEEARALHRVPRFQDVTEVEATRLMCEGAEDEPTTHTERAPSDPDPDGASPTTDPAPAE